MALKRSYVEDLSGFEWHLRVAGRSAATVRAYLAVVRRYLPVAQDCAAEPVRRYLQARGRVLAAASFNLEISALRSWFAYQRRLDPGAWQPEAFPRMRRLPRRLAFALRDEDVGMLLAAPDLGTFVGFRDHMIMATLYQCGLRAGELVRLRVGDVQPDGLLLVRGKGNAERLVPYGGAWRALLEEYVRRRVGTRPGRRCALFVTVHGRPLRDARSVWVIVNRYARRALGLAAGYGRLERAARGRPWRGHYPHQLRAAFATELLRRGLDIVSIAQMLGHVDVSTTERYTAVDLRMLREALAKHPRATRREGAE